MHKSSLDKMNKFREDYLDEHLHRKLKILDIGSCDVNGSYKHIFEDVDNWIYVGADITVGNNVDVVLADLYDWKEIKSNTYDVVITGQTFEHIEFFWITVLEIWRILKPGGYCCIIAPSAGHEHKFPVDCWRFYPDGFRALCKYSGLVELKIYTQWDSMNYDDGSDVWRDSVLICKKPHLPFIQEILRSIRNYCIRKIF